MRGGDCAAACGGGKMFVPFINLTASQQRQAVRIRPKWAPEQFRRMEFWVRKNDQVCRRPGHHRLTEAAGAQIDRVLRAAWDHTPTLNGKQYKSADFGLAPERDSK
jgi:hypothetical protein